MRRVVGWFRLGLLFAVLSALPSPCRAEEAAVSEGERSPGIVQCSPEVRVQIERMLAQSPTFRSQYQRVLDHPRLVIAAVLDPTINGRSFRARSTIRRYTSGLVVVHMAIAPGRHVAEFVAHEFEHVLEKLEGLDLTDMAERGVAGIWFSGPSLIETSRAARAGRAVVDEMRARDRRPDNLVQ